MTSAVSPGNPDQSSSSSISDDTAATLDQTLDGIPAEEAEETRLAQIQGRMFVGPLPPPALLAEYENILPGAGDRITTMAEKEQEHRIEWEQNELRTSARHAITGQWLAFSALALCLMGAAYTATIGKEVTAGLFLGAAALGVVGKFLDTRWAKRQSPDQDPPS